MVLECHLDAPVLEHDAFLKHDPGKNADFFEAGSRRQTEAAVAENAVVSNVMRLWNQGDAP
jgi:hypothetical protein